MTRKTLPVVWTAVVLAGMAGGAGAAGVPEGPVKIFLLVGQSTRGYRALLGDLQAPPDGQRATLVHYIMKPENVERYKFLYRGPEKTDDGWTVRQDVFVSLGPWPHARRGQPGYSPGRQHGPLSPHAGQTNDKTFGTELGIGHVLGDHCGPPVLLVKVDRVESDLADHLRAASPCEHERRQYGHLAEAVEQAIEHLPDIVPGYDASRRYELAGLFWSQKPDRADVPGCADRPEKLVALVRDVRKALAAPAMRVVVARMHKGRADSFRQGAGGQVAVWQPPQLEATVAVVEVHQGQTHEKPERDGGPAGWGYADGRTCWLIGRAMGRAMVGLLSGQAMAVSDSGGEVEPVYPGTKSLFAGRYAMYCDGDNRIVVPARVAEGKPWVWRARFWGHQPQFDLAMLERGYHVVYCDVTGLLGNAEAVERWNRFYRTLVERYGFARKAVLEGMSRGGLIVYNWAIANPDKVAAIYGDAPVMDLRSWPGYESRLLKRAYRFDSLEQFLAFRGNPIDNLKPLADAKVPIIHVVGDRDTTVPAAENTAVAERRYRAMGGLFKVIHKKDVGHHPHSLEDPTPIVQFIEQHARH